MFCVILTLVLNCVFVSATAVFGDDRNRWGAFWKFCDEQDSIPTRSPAVGGGVTAMEPGPCIARLVGCKQVHGWIVSLYSNTILLVNTSKFSVHFSR